ncbi:monooxygenase [Sphaerisporangium sp. TRM90804]|uniref:monooxygenase n=1 Tax=Sphaerisporangium sp. TRM90804 TaxID=3031113 RepID=UPI00244860F0|nr:monooxygenase [Sphaerisporangium sp. TRM90804]MDH2428382.1 monooxygenase [Sphaerisporangium sp. TRM90804]
MKTTRWLSVASLAVAGALVVGACGPGASTARQPVASSGSPGAATHSGHGMEAAPPPPAAPLRSGERFVNLKLPKPYTPAAPPKASDEYRCFLLDPGLTAPAFLTGNQFLAQNTSLVHHAIVYAVDQGAAEKARTLDASTPGEGWTCFGDAGIEKGKWIGHWAPGADETLLTQKVGHPVAAGSRLVLQIHYNLLASEGKPAGSDQSGIRLRFADGAAELTPLETSQVAAPIELPCAKEESGPLCDRDAAVKDLAGRFGAQAGETPGWLGQACNDGKPPAAGSTQRCDRPLPTGGTIYALAGHMHLLGRSIKVELNPGRPGERTLLDIPRYNFDEQAIRPLAKPVAVKKGDHLRVTCTHDAGLRKMLPALKTQPPRYVVWGEGTSDEMCLGLVVWTPGV